MGPLPAKRLEGVGEYYFSTKLREIAALNQQGAGVINLGIGSPDLPPHPDVIRVLQEEAARPGNHAYQIYRGAEELRRAIAGWYQRWYGVSLDPASEVLPLIGSKEGILHLCMTYLGEGDKALVPDPGYPTYRSAVQLAGAQAVPYFLQEKEGWQPDLEALEQEMRDPATKLLFVNFPHMPTGVPARAETLEALVSLARKHEVLIVHDNPYSFILNDRPQSLLAVPGAKECVVELNSLSKSHNLAGWRVGMLCGAAHRIDEVLRFKSNMDSGMFLPVQRAAARALELGPEWFASLNQTYAARRSKAEAVLNALNCTVGEAQNGLFLWAKVPAGFTDGYALTDAVLQQARVFITPGGIFGAGGRHFIRISLCAPEAVFEEAWTRIKNSAL